jgi:hypothetical protein
MAAPDRQLVRLHRSGSMDTGNVSGLVRLHE